MDIQTLRAFFLWCTILNGSLLLLSFAVCASAGDWIHRMHGKWFPVSREAFYVAIYSFLGLYKILVLTFNLVPYLALLIAG